MKAIISFGFTLSKRSSVTKAITSVTKATTSSAAPKCRLSTAKSSSSFQMKALLDIPGSGERTTVVMEKKRIQAANASEYLKKEQINQKEFVLKSETILDLKSPTNAFYTCTSSRSSSLKHELTITGPVKTHCSGDDVQIINVSDDQRSSERNTCGMIDLTADADEHLDLTCTEDESILSYSEEFFSNRLRPFVDLTQEDETELLQSVGFLVHQPQAMTKSVNYSTVGQDQSKDIDFSSVKVLTPSVVTNYQTSKEEGYLDGPKKMHTESVRTSVSDDNVKDTRQNLVVAKPKKMIMLFNVYIVKDFMCRLVRNLVLSAKQNNIRVSGFPPILGKTCRP